MALRSVTRLLKRARAGINEDITAAMKRDPALTSRADAILNSPGLHAIWSYRVSHSLWQKGGSFRLPARVLSTITRSVTGVEIHPGAKIGRRCFIDHGMGVVIGETAIVGDDAMFYHGSTLGGRSDQPTQRHPILGDRVMVGAGACILGSVMIGDDAKIGANAVVVHDVPAGSTAVGTPAKIRTRSRS